MSLLDTANESVVVYPEVVTTDADGNVWTRPSTTGIPLMARIEARAQSGTSSRRAEQDNEGYESEQVYTLKFPRGTQLFGAQSQVEWRGVRWALHGHPVVFNRSPATAHESYTIRRF